MVTLHMLHLVFKQGLFVSASWSGSTFAQNGTKIAVQQPKTWLWLAAWPVPAAAAAECWIVFPSSAVHHASPRLVVSPLCSMFIYVSLPPQEFGGLVTPVWVFDANSWIVISTVDFPKAAILVSEIQKHLRRKLQHSQGRWNSEFWVCVS